jgi:hypothetical protein
VSTALAQISKTPASLISSDPPELADFAICAFLSGRYFDEEA